MTDHLEIQSNFPMPQGQRSLRVTRLIETLRSMEVGQSFIIPRDEESGRTNLYKIAGLAGVEISVRKVRTKRSLADAEYETRYCVWRVA